MSELLSPIDDASPCGPDLEYDPAFMDLERAAAGRPEQEAGGVVTPAQEPEWRTVREQAIELLGRSKDLRVAVMYTHSLAYTEGLAGWIEGLRVVRGLLESYWPLVHPMLDASDGDDPTMRLNALAGLSDPDTGVRAVRASVWIELPGMRVTVRQALGALGVEPAGSDGQMDASQIDGVLHAFAQSDTTNHARIAIAELRGISAVLDEHLGAGAGLDFAPLRRTLSPLADRFDRVAAPADAAGEEDGGAGDAAGIGAAGGSGAGFSSGPIRSRDDAMRALDAVCRFLEQSEPSNPAPLLIRRAQRLIGMGFLEIMRDLAPESLPAVEHIAGSPQHES